MNKKTLSIYAIIILIIISITGCIEEENIEDNNSIIYVGYSQNADFNKIQKAIDNSTNGSTIYVQNGSYTELIIINKSINLIGDGINKTTIDFNIKGEIGQITGIHILSNNTKIKGFNITKTSGSANVIGIKIESSNNQILNNKISRLTDGINIDKQTLNNTIKNNIISNNYYGIQSSDSDYNNISNNNVSNSGLYGIYLHQGSDSNIISNNSIFNNKKSSSTTALRIKGSKYNIVTKNEIIKNRKGLLCCCGANFNKIYNNIFIENQEYNANEYSGLSNTWFDANLKIGNYWDDHNWTDFNEDGYSDLAYIIYDEGNRDVYPLMKPEIQIII